MIKAKNKHQLMLIPFILLLSLLWGCIEEVSDVNLPKVEPKLVITSFITPNDTIKVKVTKSVPFNYNQPSSNWETQYPPIVNALVTLRNILSNQSVTIEFNQMLGYYMMLPSEFPIEYGQEYELKVSAPGLKSISAMSKIPGSNPELLNYKIDTIGTYTYQDWDGNSQNYYDIMCTGTIKDVSGEKNFYSFGLIIWEDSQYPENGYETSGWYLGSVLFTDTERDGQEISFRTNFSIMGWQKMLISIYSSDEGYFLYHKSVNNWQNDNPFSEPTPLYSNIDGGLGIFCSYTSVQVTVEANPEK